MCLNGPYWKAWLLPTRRTAPQEAWAGRGGPETRQRDDVSAGVCPGPVGRGRWRVRGPAWGQPGTHPMATVLGQGEDTLRVGIRKEAVRTQDTLPAALKQMARPSAASQASDPGAQWAVCRGCCWGRVGRAAGAWSGQHSWCFLGPRCHWTPRLVLPAPPSPRPDDFSVLSLLAGAPGWFHTRGVVPASNLAKSPGDLLHNLQCFSPLNLLLCAVLKLA